MTKVTPLRDYSVTLPPAAPEVEMALLGALVQGSVPYEEAAQWVGEDDFTSDIDRAIFGRIKSLTMAGKSIDPPSVMAGFSEQVDRDRIAKLAANTMPRSGAQGWAESVKDYSVRRRLIDYAVKITTHAHDIEAQHTAGELCQAAAKQLEAITDGAIAGQGPRPIRDIVHDAMATLDARRKHDGHLIGLATGLKDLDELLCGLQDQHLIILGGRPSMGKSTLARHIAFRVAKAGTGVAVFSLEMTGEEWATQQLADNADVNMQQLRRGWIKDHDFDRVLSASNDLVGLPLFIEDDPGLTVGDMRLRAHQLKRRHNIGLVIADHIQIIRPERAENRTQELTQITRDLKRMAKTLGVPVLALCQLNRGLEQRDDKRPILADLRESGSIEQDADEVIFIYRDRYYNRDEPKKQRNEDEGQFYKRVNDWMNSENVAELIVAKQRMGPIDTVKAFYDGKRARFRDLAFGTSEDMGL